MGNNLYENFWQKLIILNLKYHLIFSSFFAFQNGAFKQAADWIIHHSDFRRVIFLFRNIKNCEKHGINIINPK